MVFVGPSGCGKTTALRMVAGLEEISDGEIRIGDEVVNDLAPRDRDVAMVFQNYALYPHKTVFENLAFPLKLRKLRAAEIDEKVQQIARLLELEEHLKRRPRQLSGGQRQRVAMGRPAAPHGRRAGSGGRRAPRRSRRPLADPRGSTRAPRGCGARP